MLGQAEQEGAERECPGSAPGELPCNQPAIVHCVRCGQWFCDIHAEDEERHPCMREMHR